eukprot:g18003.t1
MQFQIPFEYMLQRSRYSDQFPAVCFFFRKAAPPRMQVFLHLHEVRVSTATQPWAWLFRVERRCVALRLHVGSRSAGVRTAVTSFHLINYLTARWRLRRRRDPRKVTVCSSQISLIRLRRTGSAFAISYLLILLGGCCTSVSKLWSYLRSER